MPARPLLVLGQPQQVTRTQRRGGPSPMHLPPWQRQRERLLPQFDVLEHAFDERRAALQGTPSGLAPEQVVILETIGSVEDFLSAVRRIPGMEWLGEWDESDLPPDDDFYRDEGRRDATLEGRLYLVMTNQQAMEQLLSLWRRFQGDPDARWERGKTRWRDLFRHLKTVRLWGVEERLYGTGVLEDWRERIEHGQERVRAEVELWFRDGEIARQRAQSDIVRLIEGEGGRLLGQAMVSEISYHALLAELPATAVEAIVRSPQATLVQADQVMFFRPVGQAAVPASEDDPIPGPAGRTGEDLPAGDPVVALFDGLPVENHRLLAGRLTVDDPDGWAAEYPVANRFHGTAMASLIVHGELDANEPPLDRPIYVRPVLRPSGPDWLGPPQELVPESVLPVDLLHRAVRRLFEGEGAEPSVAPTVRVVNFSVGDRARPFERQMSPYARMIDWLSERYNVLFVVSAGNQDRPLTYDCAEATFLAYDPRQLEAETLKVLARSVGWRRLLSPSEAANALTVGAVHADACGADVPAPGYVHDPFNHRPLPSPISAIGPGYRRSMKPDILLPGGRQIYRRSLTSANGSVTLEIATTTRAPGQKVATPGSVPGDLEATRYSRGTSNAAALATRQAAHVYDALLQLRASEDERSLGEEYTPILLKALLTHAASWSGMYDALAEVLKTPDNSRTFKEHAGRFLGYGAVDVTRLGSATDQRATMVGCAAIQADEAHVHRIPLPPSLSGRRLWRRLTITLAWLTPINASHRSYRRAALWVDTPDNPLRGERQQCDYRAAQRGTLQHEVFEGDRATPFVDGDAIRIQVNCRADAGDLVRPVRYALAVSLEVAEGIEVPIYQEIQQRIRVPVRV